MNRHTTGCGLTLGVVGDYVLPLTRCCGAVASAVGVCEGCGWHVREGYTLAALLGHRHFARDLRSMLECLTECDQVSECVADLLVHFGAAAIDHTHVDA